MTDMMDNIKWLNIQNIYEPNTAIMLHPICFKILSNEYSRHFYETRNIVHGVLYVPNAHLKDKQREFQYRVSNIWNKFPVNIRYMSSLKAFMSAYNVIMLQLHLLLVYYIIRTSTQPPLLYDPLLFLLIYLNHFRLYKTLSYHSYSLWIFTLLILKCIYIYLHYYVFIYYYYYPALGALKISFY